MHTLDLINIKNLPIEIESYIKEFIPIKTLCFLNKKNYIKYHKYVKKWIPKKLFENYIRDIIRRDNHFVFDLIIKENYKKWLQIIKYKYKNIIYGNFICFIDDLCIKNESTNCRNLLSDFLNKTGLSKNQHKKNTITNIIWMN
jgi:hypothetical protein